MFSIGCAGLLDHLAALVNNGSVYCPRRGEVAMELFLAGPDLMGAGHSDGDEWIACSPATGRSVYVGGM